MTALAPLGSAARVHQIHAQFVRTQLRGNPTTHRLAKLMLLRAQAAHLAVVRHG